MLMYTLLTRTRTLLLMYTLLTRTRTLNKAHWLIA